MMIAQKYQYNARKTRYLKEMNCGIGGMPMDEKEILEICRSVDSAIAAEMAESIINKVSFDMLEAHYGILPISRHSFYRRKATAERLIRQRGMRYIEERNGQLRMVWNGNNLL